MALLDGRTVVTTAGTRVQLSTSAASVKQVAVEALEGNTGKIVVGTSDVVAASGTRKGIALQPGGGIIVQVGDLREIWLDATVSGDGVSYFATDVPGLQLSNPGTQAVTGAVTADTELPAAAALSDTNGNPTTPMIGAAAMGWDGFNNQWHRLGVGTGFGDGVTGGNALVVLDYFYNGATWDRHRKATKFVSLTDVSVTAGTGLTLLTPTAGKKFRLMGWCFSLAVAGQLIFGDNAVGTVIVKSEKVAAGGVTKVEQFGNGFLSAAANNVLKLDVTATGNVGGFAMYCEE